MFVFFHCMIIFALMHCTYVDHPYKEIMLLYLREKLEKSAELPQIVGLTSSLGAGKGRSDDDCRDHLLELCANLDVLEVVTVRQEANVEAMRAFTAQPDERMLLCSCLVLNIIFEYYFCILLRITIFA